MTRSPHALLLATLALTACGPSSPSSSTTASGATAISSNTPTQPLSRPVDAVHGTLVTVPSAVIAFLPDGATTPLELLDPAQALANVPPTRTLTVSGTAAPNHLGQTSLPERLTLSRVDLDDLQATATLDLSTLTPTLRSTRDHTLEPTGPLAASLLAEPAGIPLRITGRFDTTRPVDPNARTFVVTSFRRTATLTLATRGGLIGADEAFTVTDVPATGAFQLHDGSFVFNDYRRGRGRLSPADLATVQQALATANLPNQPTYFSPTQPVLDVPTHYLEYHDDQVDLSIGIAVTASLPRDVQALVDLLRTLSSQQTTFQTLEAGATSSLTQASTQTFSDDRAWTTFYAQHRPNTTAPSLDFNTQRAVAVFLGQRPTADTIEITDLERIGDSLYLTTTTTPSTNPAPTPHNPHHLVSIRLQGATGSVHVR